MPQRFNIRHHGPRVVVVVSSLANIVTYFMRLYDELPKTKDLPSDTMMAQFMSKALVVVFFSVVLLQRIAACFTSTTILVQLAFYIWTIEGIFKSCIIVATIAILSFNRDLNNTIQAWRLSSSQDPHHIPIFPMFPVGFYVSFVVGVGLRMILNDLRKRDNEIQHQKELLLRLEKEMPPLPATTTTTKKYPSSSTDRSLTESGVQRRLLRVRTWPRIITSLHFVVITVGFFVVAPDVLSRVDDMSWILCASNVLFVVSGPLGLYAILRKSLRASRWVLWATLISNIYESYDIFNDLRSKYPQPHQNAALNFTTTVPVPQNSSPDDFLKLFALFMFSTVHHLITVLSIWQVIRDLEKRDKRVAEAMAKTKVDSAVASGDDQPDTSCSKDSSLEPSVVMEMPVAEPA